ncbi:uncharacterized protein ARMOST_22173 [Armillaria ostoyae]|uniref:Uncharacterized protein n=1 Tax=Armillaria ostoyae TaxID=47428 RepID=A0A284SC48_ARMOS|nr:uncharacterized protein ARMOST_22173 [Armillaria ostoyae]
MMGDLRVLIDVSWGPSLVLSIIPRLPSSGEPLFPHSPCVLKLKPRKRIPPYRFLYPNWTHVLSGSVPSVDSPLIGDMHRKFMIVLILLFVTRAFGAQTSLDDNKGVPACIEDQRTVLRIIWSCLATIFACTWIAVHPNVPGRNITTKGAISCAIERAKIMAITILGPELIVGWATEQFIVAWNLRHRKHISIASVIHGWREPKDDSKLTLAHGFLVSMGGLCYTRKYEIPHQALEANDATSTPPPSSPPSSLHESFPDRTTPPNSRFLPDGTSGWETWNFPGTLVTLEALESEPNLVTNLAAISPETIEDKSKGDALSKTVSILQISWFIVQCIARAIQRLPLTLLEITALAFAGLSIMTYLLWWYKPLNVKYHISLDGSYSKPMPEMPDLEAPASPVNPSWAEWAYHRLFSVWEWIGLTLTGQRRSVDGRYKDIGDGAFRFYSGKSNGIAYADTELVAALIFQVSAINGNDIQDAYLDLNRRPAIVAYASWEVNSA